MAVPLTVKGTSTLKIEATDNSAVTVRVTELSDPVWLAEVNETRESSFVRYRGRVNSSRALVGVGGRTHGHYDGLVKFVQGVVIYCDGDVLAGRSGWNRDRTGSDRIIRAAAGGRAAYIKGDIDV